MKKFYNIFLCALCAFALFSCEKEQAPDEVIDDQGTDVEIPEGYVEMNLTAICDASKTSLSEGNTVWSENDQIKVFFDSGDPQTFTLRAEDAGKTSGLFSGVAQSGATPLYAVYPVSVTASVSGSTVNVTVPAAQTDGTFAAGNIAVAKVDENRDMAFKNVASMLSFTLAQGSNVKKVEVSSVDGTALVGTIPVDCSNDTPTPDAPESGSSTVSLTTSEAKTYYIALAPVSFGETPAVRHTKGLLLKYYSGTPGDYTETGAYYINKNIPIVANNLYNIGELETTKQYYVKPTGTGTKDGMSWGNAMGITEFKKKIIFSSSLLTNPSGDPETKAAKIAAIQGATFHFSADSFDFGNYLEIDYSNTSRISYTIEGEGSGNNMTTFVGRNGSTAGMLWPKANTNITVKNVKFSGTNGNSNYGAIRVNTGGTILNLEGCIFHNNRTGGQGSALCLFNGTVNVEGCTFDSNYAATRGGVAFISNSAHLSIENSTFVGNHANGAPANNEDTSDYGGGVIYIEYKDGHSPVLALNSCTFGGEAAGEPNYAVTDGGVLYLTNGTATITDCTFTNDYAENRGGAIYTETNCTINKSDGGTGSILTGNYANAGGAIYANTGTVNISDARFTGNHADGTGKNDAYAAGGAIYAKGSGLTLSCKGVLFEENYNYVADGPSVGGIIRVMESGIVAKFDDCTFDGNYTNRNTSTGEAPYAAVVQADIDGTKYYFNACEFKNNTSGTANWDDKCGGCNGTVLAATASCTIALNNCSVHDNYGGRNKDDISWIGMDNANSTLILANTTIAGDNYRASGERKNNWGVIKFNSTGNYYLLNSIICSLDDTTSDGGSKGNCFWVNGDISVDGGAMIKNGGTKLPVNCWYSKTSKEGDNRTNWVNNTGSGHDYYATSASFGSWTMPYIWNGTLTGTNSGMLAATADVNTQIEDADADFYAWLNNIGALGKDIKGNSRGATSWPGCYQN